MLNVTYRYVILLRVENIPCGKNLTKFEDKSLWQMTFNKSGMINNEVRTKTKFGLAPHTTN